MWVCHKFSVKWTLNTAFICQKILKWFLSSEKMVSACLILVSGTVAWNKKWPRIRVSSTFFTSIRPIDYRKLIFIKNCWGAIKCIFFSFMFSLDWLGIRWVCIISHARYLKENDNSAIFFSFRYSTWLFNHTRLLISPRKCIRIVCILDPWPVWMVFEYEDDLYTHILLRNGCIEALEAFYRYLLAP